MNANDSTKLKLCAFSLGIAFGVVEGLYMLLLAWAGLYWGYGLSFIQQTSELFYGYAPTLLGGVYGGLWGLVDGFIFGMLVGLVYNYALCYRCKKSSDKAV